MKRSVLTVTAFVLCSAQMCGVPMPSTAPVETPPTSEPAPAPAPPDPVPPPEPVPPPAAPSLSIEEIQQAAWQILVCSNRVSGEASAFAVAPDLLATNAHVVLSVAEALRRPEGTAIAIQHETGVQVDIEQVWIHPAYEDSGIFTTPDVGVIRVSQSLPVQLTLASQEALETLAVGDELRMCGFPGDVSLRIDPISCDPGVELRPRASCLTGRVTALRPFDASAAATPENTQLVQHELGTTGGTSGSALVNNAGLVIAVHALTTGNEGGLNRFGMRVDTLQELLDGVRAGTATPLSLEKVPGCSDLAYYNAEWGMGLNPPPDASDPVGISDPIGEFGVQWEIGPPFPIEYQIQILIVEDETVEDATLPWFLAFDEQGFTIVQDETYTFNDGRPGWLIVANSPTGFVYVQVFDLLPPNLYLATGIGLGGASSTTSPAGRDTLLGVLADFCVEHPITVP